MDHVEHPERKEYQGTLVPKEVKEVQANKDHRENKENRD